MRDNPGDKYKKIDPWKLVGDTFNPDTYIDLGLKIISWPFSIFKKSIPPHAKNNSRIKILIFLISIENNFKNLSLRELKIASNILNCRWIPNNKNGTINEITGKLLFDNLENNIEIINKYLTNLSNYQLFYLYLSLVNLNKLNDSQLNINLKNLNDISKKDACIEEVLNIYIKNRTRILFEFKNPEWKNNYTNEYSKLSSNILIYLSSLYSSIVSTDSLSKELDNITKNLFEDSDTVYKAAVDANYMSDKSSFGGPYHRLFDDSHSIGKMYEKIKDAKPDDSKLEEIIAWVNEAAKDLQTTMGLPIVSMDKETFDKTAEFLAPVGISKNDLYDLLTYNLQEVLSVAFLGITTIIPSIKKDKNKLNTLRGIMIAAGAFGNPLAIIFLVITLIHSWLKGSSEEFKKSLTSKEAFVGFSISAIIKYTIDFLGSKAVITIISILMALLIVVYLFRNKNKKIDIQKFKLQFVRELENLREMSKNQLEKQNIKPLPK